MELCLCAWRLALEGSSMGACGAPAGNVKRLLPPRQSRGISFVSLADHLDRTIERHQTGLDRELGLTFAYLLAEL